MTYSCIANGIYFSNTNKSNYWISNTNNQCVKIFTSLLSPTSSTISFKIICDYTWAIYIDDVLKVSGSGNLTFSAVLPVNLYYTLYIEWCNIGGSFKLDLYWAYNGGSYVQIPSSNLFLPYLVSNSPFTVN